MLNIEDFKSGPKRHFVMDEHGQLIEIPSPLPTKNPIRYEIESVDGNTINIVPPHNV